MITLYRCYDENGQLLLSTPNRAHALARSCAVRETVLFPQTPEDLHRLREKCRVSTPRGERTGFAQQWARVVSREQGET